MFVKKQEYVYKKRNFEGGFNIKGQGQMLKDTAPSPWSGGIQSPNTDLAAEFDKLWNTCIAHIPFATRWQPGASMMTFHIYI